MVDILAIGVHPDDVELSCSGTIMKHIDMGYSAAIVDLTRGELGSRGTIETRKEEARAAQIIMGVEYRENLGMEDGFFAHNEENLKKIIRILRKYRPKIVLANAIDDRHPDHGRAAKLTADACFLSGLLKIETLDENGNKQLAWRPNVVYHYTQDRNLEPDFVIDITAFYDRKIQSILAYSTQFSSNEKPITEGPQTPISSPMFLESLKAKDRVSGRLINVEFAEPFTTHRAIGVNSLFDIL